MTGAIQSTVGAVEVPLELVDRLREAFLRLTPMPPRSDQRFIRPSRPASGTERDLRLETLNHVRSSHP